MIFFFRNLFLNYCELFIPNTELGYVTMCLMTVSRSVKGFVDTFHLNSNDIEKYPRNQLIWKV